MELERASQGAKPGPDRGSGEPIEAAAPLAAAPAPDSEMSTRSTASAEAFRELALALRTSVEAMHGVRELQADLVRSLKRQDRSELILQSTQALNDTFRGLATIQREMLRRLSDDTSQRRTRGGGRLVPLMLLGLLVVFLGGVYVVLDVMADWRDGRFAATANAAGEGEDALEAYREGKADGVAEADTRLATLQDRVAEMEDRDGALRRERGAENEELRALNRELEERIDRMAGQVRSAQTQVLAGQAVEQELRDTAAQLAVATPRLREMEIELERRKLESARLRRRLADVALGVAEPGPNEVTPPSSEPGSAALDPRRPTPSSAPKPADRIERDPALLTKIRDRLNQMLDASARGRSDMWQITEIQGVTSNRLDGVVLRRYDRRTGRLLSQTDARKARIWVDRNRRAVEFELAEGKVTTGARSQPLPQGAARQVIADGEMTRLWSQSGLLFLQFR